MRWRGATSRFSLIGLVIVLAAAAFLPVSTPVRANASRGPIVIDSDAAFTSANGVVSGTGTEADPYVIGGWDIAGPTDPAISIQATRAWFVIRNVTTIRGDYYEGYRGGGIRLLDVQNARIESVILQGTNVGVLVQGSVHVRLADIEFDDSPQGITAIDSTDVSVSGTRTPGGWPYNIDSAVAFRNITGGLIADNTITTSNRMGIAVSASVGVTVRDNTISGSGSGIFVAAQNGGLVIENNTLFQNGDGDVVLEGSTNITIRGNRLSAFQGADSGFVVRGDFRADYDSHNISADNLVAGRPLLAVEQCSGLTLNNTSAGQIYIAGCTDVRITNLTMAVIGAGVTLAFVDGGMISESTFRGGSTSILLRYSTHVRAFHNNFIVASPSDQFGMNNTWDDGYPSGGNYYGGYTGVDANGDGIGDSPLGIYEYDVDRYPLIRPYGIPAEPPVVVFTLSETTVQAMGSFYFDGSGTFDPDGTIATGKWIWGNGYTDAFPGITSGYYAYEQPGTYTITLTVTDNSGLTASVSHVMTVVAYVPPAPPLPSIGSPTIVEKPGDFRVPVPDDWSVQLDATVGGTKIDLVAVGPTYNNFRTNLLVLSEADDSVRETHAYLDGLVQGTVAGVQDQDPSAYQAGTSQFLVVSNHSAVSFVIVHPSSGVVQDVAAVVSEAHHRVWVIVLSFDGGLATLLAPLWGTVLAGFEITAAVPPSPFPFALAIVGGVVAVFAAIIFLALRARRNRRETQIVYPPAPPTFGPAPPKLVGASGSRFCPRCGTATQSWQSFCMNCGASLSAPFGVPGLPSGNPPKGRGPT